MKPAKTIYTVLLFILTLSCSRLLEKHPVSSFSADGFYKTPGDAQAGIHGIYDAAQAVFRVNFAYWGEGRADNVKTDQSGEGLMLLQNNLDGSLPSAYWQPLYNLINRANYAIKFIPNAYSREDRGMNRLIGEARALRALGYFYLVQIWGNVPFITEPYLSVEQEIFVSRTNKETILDFIEEDLKYAAENCHANFGNERDRIMFTKGSANALLTKVYMWRHKYNEALITSDMVLKNSLYALVTTMEDWSKIFTDGYSKESIFEVGYNDKETNMLRLLYALGSYAIYTPSEKFKNSYESGDKRIPYIYDVALADPKAIWKFLGKGVSDEDPTPSKQNIVLIRLADIVLLRAEALNKTGKKEEALSLLNQIRARAGLKVFDSEAEASVKYGDLESAILQERSVELCFEGHRWFDLVRTGKAIPTMKPLTGLNNEKNIVWPVSFRSIEKNPKLEQNEYYK